MINAKLVKRDASNGLIIADENVPMGFVYQVDPDDKIVLVMFDPVLSKEVLIPAIMGLNSFTSDGSQGRGGYIPLECLELEQ